jgi:hypothetical protein
MVKYALVVLLLACSQANAQSPKELERYQKNIILRAAKNRRAIVRTNLTAMRKAQIARSNIAQFNLATSRWTYPTYGARGGSSRCGQRRGGPDLPIHIRLQ